MPAKSASSSSASHQPSSLNTRNASSPPKASLPATFAASSSASDSSKKERASLSTNTSPRLDVATQSALESPAASTTLELTSACGPTVDSCASSREDSCQRATKIAHKRFSECLLTFFILIQIFRPAINSKF